MGAVSSIGDALTGAVDSVVNVVSDIGSTIDDAVHEVIPGGWGTVAAVAGAALTGGASLAADAAAGAADAAGVAGAADAAGVAGAADAMGTAQGLTAYESALPAADAAGAAGAGVDAASIGATSIPVPPAADIIPTALSPLDAAGATPYSEILANTPAGGPVDVGIPSGQLPSVDMTGFQPGADIASPYAAPAASSTLPVATQDPFASTPPETPVATSYDSFGNPVEAGSAAATSADPTGLAQAQLDANAAASASANPGLLNTVSNFLSGNVGGSSLTGAGLLAGGAGLAGLLSLIQSDSSRYGTPGRATYSGPLSQYKFNPATYQASTPNPAMFRPTGVTTVADQARQAQPSASPFAQLMAMTGGQQQNPMQQLAQTAGLNVPGMAAGGMAHGGELGGYSDGGRMLKGPGDGMSDSIPATIGGKRPARLADGEFVVPADVVSHLGNGSTEAGARELYKMMDKVRQARTGRKVQGKQINPGKFMPK